MVFKKVVIIIVSCGLTSYLEYQRKEKLGERIAALQQLVSPFGKVTEMQCF